MRMGSICFAKSIEAPLAGGATTNTNAVNAMRRAWESFDKNRG